MDPFKIFYYHGSQIKLKVGGLIEPRPTKFLDGKRVVFITPWKWFATVIMAYVPNKNLNVCIIDGISFIEELKSGIIDRYLKGKHGWIYSVDAAVYERDTRLILHGEMISYTPVKILEVEFIPDILVELKKMNNVVIINFED